MPNNERSTDLILRAQVDQAIQPLSQVTAKIKELTASLEAQKAAALTGVGSTKDYDAALKELIKTSDQLLLKREALIEFSRRQAALEAQEQAVSERRQKRDAFAAALPDPGERTQQQINALNRMDAALVAPNNKLIRLNESFQKSVQQLQQMGVLTEQLDARFQRLAIDRAHAEISTAQLQSAQTIQQAKTERDPFAKSLQEASERKKVDDERTAASARFISEQEREREATERAAQAIRDKGRAIQDQIRDTAFTQQLRTGRGIAREDIEAAFKDADDEKTLAAQRAQNSQEFLAQQEKERLAEERLAEAIRNKGRAAQQQVNDAAFTAQLQAGRGIAKEDIEAAFREADAEKTLASQRAINAKEFVAQQEREREATEKAANAIREKGRAAQQQVDQSTFASQLREGRGISKEDIEAAFAEADAEKALATERAKNFASFIGQQEREREAMEKSIEAIRAKNRAEREAAAERDRIRARSEDIEAAFQARLADEVDARVRAAQAMRAPVAGPLPRTARGAVEQLGPAARGDASIDDTTAAVDKLEKAVGRGKLTLQTFNKVMDETFAVQRQMASDAGLIDQFVKQAGATDKARAAFNAAKLAVEQMGEAVKNGTAKIEELARAEARLEDRRVNLQREVTQQAQIGAALNARRINTANLTAETDKLINSAQRLAAVQQRAQAGQGGLFGLSPYQLQNLSFQANDVFTQLSLGQGVMQTFLSQGPQIFQIFETSIASMKAWIPVIGVAVAAIATLASAFERATNVDRSFRQFNATLAGTVDAVSRSASVLLGLQRNAERLGITFAEAGKTVRTFLAQDLSTERIEQFTKAAIDMSTAFGVTVEEATKRLSIIPAGSIDDLEKFLLELKLLTPELVKFFEARRADGNIDEARVATINLITDALTKQRTEAITPTSEAVIQLKNSWHDLQEEIANTQQVRNFNRIWARDLVIISGVMDSIRETLQAIRSTQGENPALKRTQAEIDATNEKANKLREQFKTLRDELIRLGATPAEIASNPVLKGLNDQIDALVAKMDAAIEKLKLLQRAGETPEGGPTTIPGVSPQGRGLANNPAAAALIDNTAATMGLSEAVRDFATRIAQIESGGRQLNAAGGILTSSAGALGAMQVMPDALLANAPPGASRTGRTITGGPAPGFYDLTDPVQNVKAGLAELARLFVKYNGDLAKVAGGYVGEGTSASAIRQRTEYLAKLGLGGATTTYGGATGTGMSGTQATQQAEAANKMLREKLERELDELRSRAAKAMLGNNAKRIEADNKSLQQYYEQQIEAAQKELGSAELTDATRAKIAEKVQIEMERLAQIRNKEDLAIQKEGDALVTSLQARIAAADKTNAEAQRQAARNAGQGALDQIAIFRNQNVRNVGGMSLDEYEAKIKSEILTAVEKATLDANKAIIDAVIKERDDRTKTVIDQLQHGTITLEEAFRQTAQIVNASAVKIKEAVDRSNADLRAQPQTPKIQQQLAANARIDPRDAKAFDALETQGLSKINDLVATRNAREQTYLNQVAQGRISAREADEAINKLYADTKTGINDAIAAQRNMIEELHNTGLISDEVYNKMIAKLDQTSGSVDNLTKHQRKMIEDFANVFVNQAITGIETIADHLGKLVVGTENWKESLGGALVAFGQFVAGVLKGIAEIILKEELLALVRIALNAVSGGTGGGFLDMTSTWLPTGHTGGIVGSLNTSRNGLNAAVWHGAIRAHNGGMLGLAPGEIPVIAKQGEEVLTADDPRHRNNMTNGKTEVTSPNIKNVLVMDPADLSKALAGAHGEKVVLTHLKNNPATVRGFLGV